jgi:hypothetical protein
MNKSLEFVSGNNIQFSGEGSATENKISAALAGIIPEEHLPGDTAKLFIGEYYFQQVVRPGFVWASGQVLTDISAAYPKLKEWLLNTGPYGGAFLLRTLSEWNAEWNNAKWNTPDTSGTRAGMSPYYVLDESADTIKVPDLRGAYQAAAGFNGWESGKTLVDAIRRLYTNANDYYANFPIGTSDQLVASKPYFVRGRVSGKAIATANSTTNWEQTLLGFDSGISVPYDIVNHPRSIVSHLCLYAGAPA